MENIANKTDGASTLPAEEFNSHKNELQDFVAESGQTLALATTDQLRKAVSVFGRSLYMEDASGTPNVLTLARPNGLTDVPVYYDGMTIVFSTVNANTGATTVTVNGLASKKVRTITDVDISSGTIQANKLCFLVYDSSLDSGAGAFVIYTPTDSMIGVNQTWQNVTASRSSGVTYTNTTGKPIFVYIRPNYTAGVSCVLTFAVNGIDIGSAYGNMPSGTYTNMSTGFIVPPGATYKVYVSGGTPTVVSWAELR